MNSIDDFAAAYDRIISYIRMAERRNKFDRTNPIFLEDMRYCLNRITKMFVSAAGKADKAVELILGQA